MITAVDTSVLLDVFGADPSFGERSANALRRCTAEGSLIACPIVWAEVSAAFSAESEAQEALEKLRVSFSPLDPGCSLGSGQAWRAYRAAGGARTRVIADFLIAAHARTHADRLLSRDRGFYRRYFEHLHVLDPSAS